MTHPIFKMCLPKQNKKGTVIDWDGTKKGATIVHQIRSTHHYCIYVNVFFS